MLQIPDRNHNRKKKHIKDCSIPQHITKLMLESGLTFPQNGKVEIIPGKNNSITIIIENYDEKGKSNKPFIKTIEKKLNKSICLEFKNGHCKKAIC